VKLKFFALFREIVGSSEEERELKMDLKVSSLLEELLSEHPDLRRYSDEILVSVNKNYASEDTVLKEGDEVAIMPPVGGG
jgi:MoaD family protein